MGQVEQELWGREGGHEGGQEVETADIESI